MTRFKQILFALALATAVQTAPQAFAQAETTPNEVGNLGQMCPKLVAFMGPAIKKAYPVTTNLENRAKVQLTTTDGNVITYDNPKFNEDVEPAPDGKYWLVFFEMSGDATGSASLMYPVDSEACYTLLSKAYPVKP